MRGFEAAFLRADYFACAHKGNSCYTFHGMERPHDFTDISILPRSLGLADDAAEQLRELRELLIFSSGDKLFGIFADEAGSVTQSIRPTPLPRAPQCVLGVVVVGGRMLTVLDPLALVYNKNSRQPAKDFPADAFIIALQSDEQLALAVDRVEGISEIFVEEIAPLGRTQNNSVICGALQHASALVTILNVGELFATAMRGAERRRRRSKI